LSGLNSPRSARHTSTVDESTPVWHRVVKDGRSVTVTEHRDRAHRIAAKIGGRVEVYGGGRSGGKWQPGMDAMRAASTAKKDARKAEVLAAMAAGATVADVVERLGVPRSTVVRYLGG
jgi:DNA-binding IclR family transcriptional regulator